MNDDKGAQPRAIAAQVLDAVLHRGRSLKAELAQALPPLADVRDRALVEAICFAALRQSARADSALRAWVPRPLEQRDGQLRALLHAGFAQLDPLGLPPHAAVDATVGAARLLGRAHQRGMVNALLRRAQREGLPAVPADAAWPAWLRERLRADWPGDYAAIVAASALPAPMWLRVNRLRVGRDEYMQRLREAGIGASADEMLADALRLDVPVAVAALPGFDGGHVSVQDGSAQAVADALAPTPRVPAPGRPASAAPASDKPALDAPALGGPALGGVASGTRVLDACAAPGGKAAHLLERDPSLRLNALDLDPKRLERVRGTFVRLGVDVGTVLRAADAADPEAWWDGVPFDAVLLDAPCSATGIVRRQPDVLLHRRAADLEALSALQARLLDAAWRVLAPAGVLLYATCSILQAENAGQVDAFLARTADAVAEPLDARFGRVSGAGRQRLPGEGGMDGFFYARLRKR